jgi:hypothetical protein
MSGFTSETKPQPNQTPKPPNNQPEFTTAQTFPAPPNWPGAQSPNGTSNGLGVKQEASEKAAK